MEKVRKFLEELKNDPKAVERLRAEVPKSFEEFLKLLAAEAKKLGHEVSESELGAFYADALKERAAKSDAAEKIVSEADDELGAVAGGEEAGSAEALGWCLKKSEFLHPALPFDGPDAQGAGSGNCVDGSFLMEEASVGGCGAQSHYYCVFGLQYI